MMTGASPVLVPREDPVGKIIFAVVVMVFGLTFFVALMTLFAALFRGQTDRCRAILEETPYRALSVGIVGYGALAGLGYFFCQRAFIQRLLETEIVMGPLVASIVVTVVLIAIVFTGAPGVFSAVGDRLEALHGREMTGLARTSLGTLIASLAGFFPIIGWCLVIPALELFAFGAGVLALAGKIRRTRVDSESVELENDDG
jgi:hypothetical protein